MPKPFRTLLFIICGSAVFAGLPLVGWGYGDLGGFVQNPARIGYLAAVVVLQVYGALTIPLPSGKGKTTVTRQRMAIPLLQVLSLAVVLASPYCDRRELLVMGDCTAIRLIGITLHVFGYILLERATTYLGRQFSIEVTIQEGHRLVTDGPYRFVRHPRYLAIILLLAGIAVVFRSWIGILFTLAVAAVFIWRIIDEEALLRREFGEAWNAYAAKTRRLIPLVL